MNEIIEAIKSANGRTDITDTEWYSIINNYKYVSFCVRTLDKQPITQMKVNRCEEVTDTYKFSYVYSNIENAMYQLNKEDIMSVSALYDNGKNIMLIVCKLSDDTEACFDIQQNLLKANS